jgi:hypothetical protein
MKITFYLKKRLLTELCPNVTPDGKYLFFLSTRDGEGLAYWVDAIIIEQLKSKK